MRIAALVLAATFALLAAGCGGGSSTSSMTPLELVANAATKTTKSDSAKFNLTITETVGPIGPLAITGSGVSDNTTHSAQMTMDLSSIAQLVGTAAGDPGAWKADLVLDGANGKLVEYMRLPALAKLLPNAKPWVKIDLEKLAKQRGIDFSQLLQTAGSQDPAQALQAIRSVGDVKEVGTEQVDGVDTTKYSGTLDPQKIAAKLGGLAKQLGTKPIPVQVWVDADGYVRKLEESMSTQVPGSGRLDMKLEVELSDFGAPVTVTPPPADQVSDLSELAKGK